MKIQKLKTTNEEYIKSHFSLSDFASKVLASMSLTTEQLESLSDTTSLQDVDVSFVQPIIERLMQAKVNNEKVLVCGDYDCDGVCATTIMYDTLQRMGIEAGYYIPNRFEEGYGLHVNTVTLAHEKGYAILLTVDNGVKAQEALQLARNKGIEIILTDHHHYSNDELIYDYFLHPNELETYYENMCGAGMAFLISKAALGLIQEHIILAAIATIGDVVPLFGLNRLLVKEGITLLNAKMYPAIQLLQNDSTLWDSTKIAFQIVPKLNCVGRLADRANVNTLVRFLCSQNRIEMNAYAKTLHALNEERKQLMLEMEKEALPLVEESLFPVVASTTFHEGLNGVLASKLVTSMRKPTMVLSIHNGICKGSIRSNCVDLTDFFVPIKDVLLSYGGHKQAAGISFLETHLPTIKDFIKTRMEKEDTEEEIFVLPISKEEANVDNVASLQSLEPFGCGFSLPLFCIEDTIDSIQSLSAGKHIKYTSSHLSYLYFNQGNRLQTDKTNTTYQFLGKLQINDFRNQKSVNMIVDYLVE